MSERYPLTESVEMYLKAIYQVVREKQAARAKDISAHRPVRTASEESGRPSRLRQPGKCG